MKRHKNKLKSNTVNSTLLAKIKKLFFLKKADKSKLFFQILFILSSYKSYYMYYYMHIIM